MGRHNVQNALAVYAMGKELGISRQDLCGGLATFAGVKRRQEIKGNVRQVMVMDDFAHHPTAVKETLNAVRAAYPGRRLWAIFEPRSNTSRRNIFEREFSQTLALADRVVVAGLHQPEKVPAGERLSVEKVVDEINRCGARRAVVIEKADHIASYVAENAAPNDIVIVMSNGGFDGVQEKILQALAG
jgi:UDP-N-acetylmuramate: L-alanyl-gamma-D-glutamyl-meso-diaminopimelate ligase